MARFSEDEKSSLSNNESRSSLQFFEVSLLVREDRVFMLEAQMPMLGHQICWMIVDFMVETVL